jgi:hypothetical protein
MTATQPRALRVFRNNRGEALESTLTNEEAVQLCRKLNNGFCKELVKKYDASRRPHSTWDLSEPQWYWLHKYALEGDNPAPPQATATPGEFLSIVRMFDGVREYAQFPKVRLLLPVPDGSLPDSGPGARQPLALTYASGATSRYPGSISVSDGAPFGRSVFYGRVDQLGSFHRMRNCPEVVVTLLRRLAGDPAGVAAQHGRLNGKCCFCDNPLTDARSIAIGYGPVCANHYGLPWGKTQIDGRPVWAGTALDHVPAPATVPPQPMIPEFADPSVQAEYDRLVRAGLDPENAAERAFDPLIREADRVDSVLAAQIKMARERGGP